VRPMPQNPRSLRYRTEFTYDGAQRRVRIVEKQGGAVLTDSRFVWCGGVICERRTSDGATVTQPLFRDGEQVAGAARFYTRDHLGSVTAVSDATSVVRGRYEFDPSGRRALTEGVELTISGFAKQFAFDAGNITLTNHRAYSADLGRWLSEDPSRWDVDTNFYTYAWNDPIRWVDPSGLAPSSCGNKPCVGPVDKQAYYGCVTYELGNVAVGVLACVIVMGVAGGPVGVGLGLICAAGNAITYRKKCLECATICLSGTKRTDCVKTPEDEDPNNPPLGLPPQEPRRPPRIPTRGR
jgi:RHS repeat-associated protein